MKTWGRRVRTLALGCTRELLHPATLGLFTLGGALLTAVLEVEWGGREVASWTLGLLAVAGGLAGGLSGAFTPGGLFHSPWIQARPPGRAARGLAAALGTWMGLGVLLLPALLLPLLSWRSSGGELREPVPVVRLRFEPGPSGLLGGPGARMAFRPGGRAAVSRILLEPLLLPGSELDLRPAPLELSLDGEPFESVGLIWAPGTRLEIPVAPPRRFEEGVLRRGTAPGAGLWLHSDSLLLRGPVRSAEAVWLWLWVGAWNLATAAALSLAVGGALLSRPTALCLGAGWAFVALADPAFRLWIPPPGPGLGEAIGPDLNGGIGWAVLGWAGACAALLAWRGGRDPDQEGR